MTGLVSWKFVGGVTLVLALAYIFMIALLALFQRSLIYHPDTGNAGAPQQAGLENGRIVNVTTQDGLDIKGWLIKRDNKRAPVILYFHGNAGHHGWRAEKLKAFHDAGFSVLIAGYRGYGGNAGRPYEQGLYRDAQAYYDWLRQDYNASPGQIIVYGESLGGGVAVKVAAENEAAGLVLETPFDSLTATARTHYPYIPFVDLLLRDHFPSDSYITKIDMSALFIIAGRDEVVPPRHGRRLYEVAQEPKQLQLFEDATHNSLDVNTLMPYIARFIRTNVPE